MSNSDTEVCKGELHKPSGTTNETPNNVKSANERNSGQPAFPASNDNTKSFSGPQKTPEQFLSLPRETRHLYARTSEKIMRDLIAQDLKYNILDD